MKKIFFTVGPSELYFTIESHLKEALKLNVPSISHRSQEFRDIMKKAKGNLREIFQLPDDFHIIFTASASEFWDKLLINFVETNVGFISVGAFSKKFSDTAIKWGKRGSVIKSPLGSFPTNEEIQFTNYPELIGLTHNETSTGVSAPFDVFEHLRKSYPESLIAVDAVSSVPYPTFDFSNIDIMYFSVQKGFGLPAGLGIGLINEKALQKARSLRESGTLAGYSDDLITIAKKASNNQTLSTPNILGIYLLSEVSQDMLNKGIDQIRRETEYKAAVMYQALDNHPQMELLVEKEELRSKTVIVAKTEYDNQSIVSFLNDKGMVIGKGYGEAKTNQIRIANFPTHSKEQMEKLADLITEFRF